MSRYAKAIIAAIGAAITAALGIIPADSTWGKVLTIAAAALTTVAVYVVPNQAPAGQPADPTQSEVGPLPADGSNMAGYGLVELLVVVFLALLIVVVLLHLL